MRSSSHRNGPCSVRDHAGGTRATRHLIRIGMDNPPRLCNYLPQTLGAVVRSQVLVACAPPQALQAAVDPASACGRLCRPPLTAHAEVALTSRQTLRMHACVRDPRCVCVCGGVQAASQELVEQCLQLVQQCLCNSAHRLNVGEGGVTQSEGARAQGQLCARCGPAARAKAQKAGRQEGVRRSRRRDGRSAWSKAPHAAGWWYARARRIVKTCAMMWH